ncbi:FA20C kinase, partial [Amia calva]|nr:FA20C kinase [Amia calva]
MRLHCVLLSMRRRSRPFFLFLFCLSLALHLFLALHTLSLSRDPCPPPPPPHHPAKTVRSAPQALTAMPNMATDWGHHSSPNMATGEGHPTTLKKATGPAQARLQALFQHPLYNLPQPQLMEDDWLLRVKSKVKESNSNTQEWESNDEGYGGPQWTDSADTHPPWLRFHLGITRWALYHRDDPALPQLLQQLSTHRIVSAVQKPGGTQLKLVMSFPNYGQALFKPMKQERDEETNLNLFYFSDFERHNAEIAAFHLDRVLGFNRVPPAVGRLVNVTSEIQQLTTDRRLARTFYTSPVGNVCFYGQCSYYCTVEHGVCGRPSLLQGSMAAFLPDLSLAPRRSWRSPWRRSYSRHRRAEWEKNPDYCTTVKSTPPYNTGTRLADLIDMAILDFLMGNMDRHHYETFEKFGNDTFLLHLDNGRAFGRHSQDEPSILAPLQQCCRIRRSTLLRLHLLSGSRFTLSAVLRESLSADPLEPLLSEPYLAALDRRLAAVLRVVSVCRELPAGLDIHDDVPARITDPREGAEKCPIQVRGQATLFGGPQSYRCGFHPKKVVLSRLFNINHVAVGGKF